MHQLMMNVHWLAPTQIPRNPAFLQCNLEPHHSCSVHSWGLGSTSAGPWMALALPKALEPCSQVCPGQIRHCAIALSHGEQPPTQNSISSVSGGAFWEVWHTESWEEEHPARDHLYVLEPGYKFSCTYPSDCLPSPGIQNGKTNCHRNILWDCSSSQQAGNVHRSSGHCCPQTICHLLRQL